MPEFIGKTSGQESPSEDISKEKEAVFESVRSSNNFGPFLHLSDRLKNDKEFILEAMRQYGPVVSYSSGGLRGDKDFMIKAINIWGHAFDSASIELQKDLDVREATKNWEEKYNQSNKIPTSIDLDKGIIREELTLPIGRVLGEQQYILPQETTNQETVLSILEKSNIDIADLQIETKFHKNRPFGDDMGNMGGRSDCIYIKISKSGRTIYQKEFWAS